MALPALPIKRLVRAFSPQRIVLFGSYAKGTAEPGSDLDLLVIMDLPGNPETDGRRARQLVATSFPPVDVTLCTAEEVDTADTTASPFLRSILGSGITVYKRP